MSLTLKTPRKVRQLIETIYMYTDSRTWKDCFYISKAAPHTVTSRQIQYTLNPPAANLQYITVSHFMHTHPNYDSLRGDDISTLLHTCNTTCMFPLMLPDRHCS